MNPSIESNLLKYLALGRLARGSSGGAILARKQDSGTASEKAPVGNHQVLAYATVAGDKRSKVYRKHVKDLMSRGAARLSGGKRVRLISDDAEDGGEKYELNVLTEYVDGDPNIALVFFAITSLDFNKHQQIGTLFKELKALIYSAFDSDALSTSSSGGPINGTLAPHFHTLFARFNRSVLKTIEAKVESVKETMMHNVERALENVEVLEEMEVKAESMESQAKLFEKRSSSVLWMMRCRYIKVTLLLAVMIGSLLAYLIYFIYTKVHTTSNTTTTIVTPATGTGGATGASGS